MKGAITSTCTPIGYMHLLKGAFKKTKQGAPTQLYRLKSHDWHKMLQVQFVAFLQLSWAHYLKICVEP